MIKIVFILSLLLMSCGKSLLKHDKLSLEKKDYFGDELRIDGYYYYKYPVNESFRYVIYFFYNNGVALHAGAIKEEDILIKEEKFKNGTFYLNVENTKYFWGVFVVNNQNIKIERWYPSSGGPLRTYIREGTILNDTTFHITQFYRNQNGEKTAIESLDEVYHFKKFSPKPDSTNKYTD